MGTRGGASYLGPARTGGGGKVENPHVYIVMSRTADPITGFITISVLKVTSSLLKSLPTGTNAWDIINNHAVLGKPVHVKRFSTNGPGLAAQIEYISRHKAGRQLVTLQGTPCTICAIPMSMDQSAAMGLISRALANMSAPPSAPPPLAVTSPADAREREAQAKLQTQRDALAEQRACEMMQLREKLATLQQATERERAVSLFLNRRRRALRRAQQAPRQQPAAAAGPSPKHGDFEENAQINSLRELELFETRIRGDQRAPDGRGRDNPPTHHER